MKVSKGRIIFQCINYTILFLLMAAALYPVLYVLAASFSSFEFLAQGKVGIIPMGFTIDAYKRILSYPMIGRAYINTIFYTVAGTAISLLLSSLAAYPLSRRPFPGQKFMSSVIVVAMTTSQMQPVRGYTAISADSPYIKEIVQLFDYFYSEEGSLLMNFGIEGETYTMENGVPTYTDIIAKDEQGRSILSMLNIYGHREWAYKQDIGYEDALLDKTYVDYRNEMEQYIRPTIPALSFTEDEREVINSTYTEIQTYKDEMINKFIMGKEPLDNFDKFVQTLKDMGIDDVLAVEQAAYDRYVR